MNAGGDPGAAARTAYPRRARAGRRRGPPAAPSPRRRLAAERLGELEPRRVQELALKPVATCAPVLAITADRVPDRVEMGADLVRAAGFEAHAQERRRGQRLRGLEMGASLAWPVAVDRSSRAHAAIAPERRIDRARPRRRPPLDEREVLAPDLPRGERRLQPPVGLLALGDDEQPRGVAIQAMDDSRPPRLASGGAARRERLGEGRAAMGPRGMDDDAGGLLDDQQVGVLVGDLVGHRRGVAAGRRRRRRAHGDRLPGAQAVVLLRRDPVDGDIAGIDPPLGGDRDPRCAARNASRRSPAASAGARSRSTEPEDDDQPITPRVIDCRRG